MSEDFNWVLKRSECSIGTEFLKLQKEAKENAVFRNTQLDKDTGIESPDSDKAGFFTVRRHEGGKNEQLVTFSLEATHIAVMDVAKNQEFKLTVCLNDLGECSFQIDGVGEFKRWQVLKKALERIFFEAK
jgi:hypothetical protein